ncbi:hypothetical protein FXV83_04010 [Bradyrhizobium hipponense]|uniref:Uncharacterized protein n=1 Tax=Bradyrhizobium hipponense TaxID=2605638 RepID=A0A5S4YXK9_9BRAD|nr:hypothetical protein [Bradyrhizobium hipponense]TYO67939.1 hypothetical protein FXV83_04010 [Bradyrhizobium hipponense]
MIIYLLDVESGSLSKLNRLPCRQGIPDHRLEAACLDAEEIFGVGGVDQEGLVEQIGHLDALVKSDRLQFVLGQPMEFGRLDFQYSCKFSDELAN